MKTNSFCLLSQDKEPQRKLIGIENLTKENSCYVNVVIQAMYHFDKFKAAFLREVFDSANNAVKVLFELHKIVKEYDDCIKDPLGKGKTLNSLGLRKELAAAFAKQEMYKLNETGDPIELLNCLLKAYHSYLMDKLSKNIFIEDPPQCSSLKKCVVHEQFELSLCEVSQCLKCMPDKKSIMTYDNNSFAFVLYTKEILRYCKMNNTSLDEMKEEMLHFSQLVRDQESSKCDKCKVMLDKSLLCSYVGEYLLLNCAWTNEEKVKMEHIIKIYYMIPLYCDNKDIFDSTDKLKPQNYELSGLILFFLKHYVSAFKEGSKWVFYDDSNWKVFDSWKDLVYSLIHNHYRPVGIFYKKINTLPNKILADKTKPVKSMIETLISRYRLQEEEQLKELEAKIKQDALIEKTKAKEEVKQEAAKQWICLNTECGSLNNSSSTNCINCNQANTNPTSTTSAKVEGEVIEDKASKTGSEKTEGCKVEVEPKAKVDLNWKCLSMIQGSGENNPLKQPINLEVEKVKDKTPNEDFSRVNKSKANPKDQPKKEDINIAKTTLIISSKIEKAEPLKTNTWQCSKCEKENSNSKSLCEHCKLGLKQKRISNDTPTEEKKSNTSSDQLPSNESPKVNDKFSPALENKSNGTNPTKLSSSIIAKEENKKTSKNPSTITSTSPVTNIKTISPVQENSIKEDTWICQYCTLENKYTSAMCFGCRRTNLDIEDLITQKALISNGKMSYEQLKRYSSQPPVENRKRNPIDNKPNVSKPDWQCSYCYAINNFKLTQCFKCKRTSTVKYDCQSCIVERKFGGTRCSHCINNLIDSSEHIDVKLKVGKDNAIPIDSYDKFAFNQSASQKGKPANPLPAIKRTGPNIIVKPLVPGKRFNLPASSFTGYSGRIIPQRKTDIWH